MTFAWQKIYFWKIYVEKMNLENLKNIYFDWHCILSSEQVEQLGAYNCDLCLTKNTLWKNLKNMYFDCFSILSLKRERVKHGHFWRNIFKKIYIFYRWSRLESINNIIGTIKTCKKILSRCLRPLKVSKNTIFDLFLGL